jgi:hypothetical protein
MSTVHLDTIGMIHDLKLMEGFKKQKAVWSVVIGIWVGKTKREPVVYY